MYANRGADAVIFGDELERLREGSGGRLTVHHHLDAERGLPRRRRRAPALAGDRDHADFYVCGPGPYMDTVEAGLDTLASPSDRVFIERFVVPEEEPDAAAPIEAPRRS